MTEQTSAPALNHRMAQVVDELDKRNIALQGMPLAWWPSLVKQRYNRARVQSQTKRKYYCSELATYILQEVGIVAKTFMPECHAPKDLVHAGTMMRLEDHTRTKYEEARIVHPLLSVRR